MKTYAFIPVVLVTVLLGFTTGTCLAERMYVTDSFSVTFRSGPSTNHKIIQMLSSGQELQALRSEDGWTLARLTGRSGETVEGWILERYLIKRQPWETQAARLRAENEGLTGRLKTVEADLKKLSEEAEVRRVDLAKREEELESIRHQYDRLVTDSAEFLELREKHDEMRAQFDENVERLRRLREENRVLRSIERTKWFATGGAVLLCGLIIGLVFGRREKKRRSTYY